MSLEPTPPVSIIIKALNEEKRIDACLDAALAAVRPVGGEVVLVDSMSDDQTVPIASRYPIRIVQFLSSADRSCGAAVQLGFQFARADFVYVLDADMLLQPAFLETAMLRLQSDPGLAAVGGKLVDVCVRTEADAQRAKRAAQLSAECEVQELGGGGLYRRAAVDSVGHLGHRGLRANEEAELGVRLRAAGWRLLRIPQVAVVHEGHQESNVAMAIRLWRNGRARSAGVFLRSSIGTPWFGGTLRKLAHAAVVPPLHFAAAALAVLAPQGWRGAVWFGCWLGLWLLMALRKRSLRSGAWSLILWHLWAAGLIRGFFDPLPDPTIAVAGRELLPLLPSYGPSDASPKGRRWETAGGAS